MLKKGGWSVYNIRGLKFSPTKRFLEKTLSSKFWNFLYLFLTKFFLQQNIDFIIDWRRANRSRIPRRRRRACRGRGPRCGWRRGSWRQRRIRWRSRSQGRTLSCSKEFTNCKKKMPPTTILCRGVKQLTCAI